MKDAPLRECCTDLNNRIDLLLEFDNWVLVIENKVRHQVNNPFDDYREFVAKAYGGKAAVFVLLSVAKDVIPKGWQWVGYREFIAKLKSNIGFYWSAGVYNKWHVILREFILNIESEYEVEEMDQVQVDFVQSNYAEIQNIFGSSH